jgi:hypothetical protein
LGIWLGVDCLPSLGEALGSISSTLGRRQREREKEKYLGSFNVLSLREVPKEIIAHFSQSTFFSSVDPSTYKNSVVTLSSSLQSHWKIYKLEMPWRRKCHHIHSCLPFIHFWTHPSIQPSMHVSNHPASQPAMHSSPPLISTENILWTRRYGSH